MSERDAYYGGRVVNGARNVTLMGDCANRLMAKDYGNIGRCSGVPKCRLFRPCVPGDYTQYHARVVDEKDGKITIETRCFKVGCIRADRPFDSSADVLEKPELVAAAIMIYELPKN
jgi:hypothetical protein